MNQGPRRLSPFEAGAASPQRRPRRPMKRPASCPSPRSHVWRATPSASSRENAFGDVRRCAAKSGKALQETAVRIIDVSATGSIRRRRQQTGSSKTATPLDPLPSLIVARKEGNHFCMLIGFAVNRCLHETQLSSLCSRYVKAGRPIAGLPDAAPVFPRKPISPRAGGRFHPRNKLPKRSCRAGAQAAESSWETSCRYTGAGREYGILCTHAYLHRAGNGL